MSGVLNGYILTVFGVTLIAAVTTAILPDGKTTAFVKSITRLACVFIVVSPVFTFFQNGEIVKNIFSETVINTDNSYIDYCSKISIENAEKLLRETIKNEYGADCEITIVWQYEKENTDGLNGFFPQTYEGERIKITEIQISFLETVSAERQNAIKYRIETEAGCEVKIIKNGEA